MKYQQTQETMVMATNKLPITVVCICAFLLFGLPQMSVASVIGLQSSQDMLHLAHESLDKNIHNETNLINDNAKKDNKQDCSIPKKCNMDSKTNPTESAKDKPRNLNRWWILCIVPGFFFCLGLIYGVTWTYKKCSKGARRTTNARWKNQPVIKI